MRQIILDTETTGLNASSGHRIIEVAGVELVNRRLTGRHYHQYICPERDIEAAAQQVHGITSEFLADKPKFHQIADDLLAFIADAELVIHNAPFDVSFLDAEFSRAGEQFKLVSHYCSVLDTLALARKKHPGQQNSLNALCKRYSVDNSGREFHGALLDAHLLAAVYLAMTGGQTSLFGGEGDVSTQPAQAQKTATMATTSLMLTMPLVVIQADAAETLAHEQRLAAIKQASDGV